MLELERNSRVKLENPSFSEYEKTDLENSQEHKVVHLYISIKLGRKKVIGSNILAAYLVNILKQYYIRVHSGRMKCSISVFLNTVVTSS